MRSSEPSCTSFHCGSYQSHSVECLYGGEKAAKTRISRFAAFTPSNSLAHQGLPTGLHLEMTHMFQPLLLARA
jgi:hypothetical protein